MRQQSFHRGQLTEGRGGFPRLAYSEKEQREQLRRSISSVERSEKGRDQLEIHRLGSYQPDSPPPVLPSLPLSPYHRQIHRTQR